MDIRKLAQLAGTSPASVSLVLNGKWRKKVRPDVAAKVGKLADKHGFVQNVTGKALAMKRHFKIAVCIEGSMAKYPVIGALSFHQLITVVASRLYEHNYSMDIVQYKAESSNLGGRLANVRSSHDGVIFVGSSLEMTGGHGKNKIAMPSIAIDCDTPSKDVSHIHTDMCESAAAAVAFLAGHGHQHIAIVRGEMSQARFSTKLKGYKRAIKTASLTFDGRLVKADMDGSSFENGYFTAGKMLKLPQKPSAFFCTDNTCALGVMRLLLEAGMRVPEDVEIIGFGDEAVANLSVPLMSFVRRPIEEMAEAAVKHLLEQIEAKTKLAPIGLKFKEELMLRGTTRGQ